MTDMKLSQPKAARTINSARVFGCLRTHENLSKAEIARILDLNKVSTGEIVDDLIRQGLVEETGKMESASGVNITLGLPIIRVSVDHGTAFDVAGKGIANDSAMTLSIDYATRMAIYRLRRNEK